MFRFRVVAVFSILLPFMLTSCATRPGTISERKGDEIMVAGKLVHTGTKVVLWTDPGGYDAYRTERRFAPLEEADWKSTKEKLPDFSSPNRYSLRKNGLTPEQIEQVRGGGWELPLLQDVVDQFVIHYDIAGTSRNCFKVLHDHRCLSVHFMLDLDGTIYQTLDAKERAWHATTSNDRSVGIEIANMGAYSSNEKNPFHEWYKPDEKGGTLLTIPERFGKMRTPNFQGRPARSKPVVGDIQGRTLTQYDFTPEQYEALAKLTAALCKIFPKIKCDYPRDSSGKLIPHKLPDDELKAYQGILGHYHVQTNKVDPGPAFQWDYVVENARRMIETPADRAATTHVRSEPAKLQR